ncbi:MAG TPA: ZIP family metal transporter [Gemmataceae bacterium]|nr:ZIP family metal transporter [Gemmataceae bacterium]
MTNSSWLAVYCVLILLFALFGGYIPFAGKVSHGKLQLCLSFSAGVMLGASFFHVMPEAIVNSGPYFGWWMSLGVVGLFCIERFVAPHSHEVNGHHHHHHNDESHHHDEHGHAEHIQSPEQVMGSKQSGEHRAAAPSVAGWAAVLGLTLHTFMNGLGLAGAVQGGDELWGMPGFAMFVAIFLHKPADALAISTVLSRKGVSRKLIFLVLLGFAAMIPVGVIVFNQIGEALDEGGRKQLVGAALAFSAGTFLFVALSDLLPEVQFHRHDRVLLFLSLTFGVALMGVIALLEGHKHGSGDEHHNGHHASSKVDSHNGDHDRGGKKSHHDEDDHDEKGHDGKHKD